MQYVLIFLLLVNATNVSLGMDKFNAKWWSSGWVKSFFNTQPQQHDVQSNIGDDQSIMPETMIRLMEKALTENKFHEAAEWRALFKIRVRLDAVCCNDKSVSAVMSSLTIREMTNPKLQEMTRQVSLEDNKRIFEKLVPKVEEALNKQTLPSPNWISKYGMNVFLGTENKELFVSNEECLKKRKEMLEQYKKLLKK